MSVPERHKIQVGLEFEFIVPKAYRLIDGSEETKLAVSSLSVIQISNYLNRPGGANVPIELFRYNAWINNKRFEHIDEDEPPEFSSAAKAILTYRLRPVGGVWYTKGKNQYLDRTEKIQTLIDTTDLDNPDEVKSALNALSRCYIDGYTRQFGVGSTNLDDQITALVAERISSKLGVKVNGITEEFITANRNGNRYEFLSDLGKRKPDWYLKEEDSLDDIDNSFHDMGLELTTPVLHPDIAMEYTRLFLELLRDPNRGFELRLNQDCGIHMNVSHTDQTNLNMSPTYIALMLDYEYYLRRFGRLNSDHRYDYRGVALEVAHKLGQYGIISLDMLEKNPKMLLDLIDSNMDENLFYVIEFTKANQYHYIEYRFMGGENYPTQFDVLQAAMEDLIRITHQMGDYLDDPFFMKALRDLLIEAEVPETTIPLPMLP